MSTMRDVARLAGVSVSTVAAVINGTKPVSAALKQKIEAAIAECGYQKPARLHEEAQRTLAVILPGLGSSFFSPLLSGVCDAAGEHGFSAMLLDSKRSLSREEALLKRCARRGIRHVILDSLCPADQQDAYFAALEHDLIERNGMRIAVIERSLSNDAFESVSVDNEAAARLAAEHLISLGRRHLAHIAGAQEFPHARLREQAFRQALEAHGIPFDEKYRLQGDFTPLSGYAAMKSLLDNGLMPDGLFAANDQMAIGAMKALTACGLRIPQDCAVVGFDNLAASSLVTPGLTTIHFPIYQLGYRAAELLAAPRSVPAAHICLNCRLIQRGSTIEGISGDWTLMDW